MVSDKTACVTSLCSECVYLGRLTQCLQEVLPTVSQQYSMAVRVGGHSLVPCSVMHDCTVHLVIIHLREEGMALDFICVNVHCCLLDNNFQ